MNARPKILAVIAVAAVMATAACTGQVQTADGQQWTFACEGPTAPPASPAPGSAACSWGPVAPTTPGPTPTTAEPSPSASPTTTPPPAPAYPTPATTGVPAGTVLTDAGTCSVPAATTMVGKRFACERLSMGAGSVLRDSEVTGEVKGGGGFVLDHVTVTSGQACNGNAAIGDGAFTALAVEVTGWADGFRVEDGLSGTVVRDSFVKLCEEPNGHGDGIQGFHGGANTTFEHNTVDQPSGEALDGITGNVFWADGSGNGLRVVDNLLIGGGYTIQVHSGSGHEVTGNRVVDESWNFGPASCNVAVSTWSDNRTVTVDGNYNITSTGGTFPCA